MNSLKIEIDRLMRSYTSKGAKAHRKLQKQRLDAFIAFAIQRGVRTTNELSYAQFEAFLKQKKIRMKTELEFCRILQIFLLTLPSPSEANRKFLQKVRERKMFFIEKLRADKLAASLQTSKETEAVEKSLGAVERMKSFFKTLIPHQWIRTDKPDQSKVTENQMQHFENRKDSF